MQIKYEIISVAVVWLYDDLTIIRTYCEVGWRFIGYSPNGAFVYFDRKYKLKEK